MLLFLVVISISLCTGSRLICARNSNDTMTNDAVSSTLTTYLRGCDFIFKEYAYISSQYRLIRCLRAVEGGKGGSLLRTLLIIVYHEKRLKPLLEPRFKLLTPGCSTNAENRIDNQHSPPKCSRSWRLVNYSWLFRHFIHALPAIAIHAERGERKDWVAQRIKRNLCVNSPGANAWTS